MTPGPLRCRVPVPGGGECMLPGGECGQAAAVGIVTVTVDLSKRDILELNPICADHAPETVHEVSISMNPTEWAVVTLAYGASGGDLR